jgi:hypothetical protein
VAVAGGGVVLADHDLARERRRDAVEADRDLVGRGLGADQHELVLLGAGIGDLDRPARAGHGRAVELDRAVAQGDREDLVVGARPGARQGQRRGTPECEHGACERKQDSRVPQEGHRGSLRRGPRDGSVIQERTSAVRGSS